MSRVGAAAFFTVIALMALRGLALVAGGIWLIVVGGSWFYFLAGLAFLLSAALVAWRRPESLIVYAVLVLATLGWALWEIGLDWWPFAARGDVIFVIGILLLLPFVTRRLERTAAPGHSEVRRAHPGPLRGSGLALTGALLAALVAAVAAWFTDQHSIQGTLAGARVAAALPGSTKPDIPPGEWHAYGRTGWGQRYSPLDQITPANVDRLEVAWHYHTGDEPQPGDPTETTFEVTPLKIGDLLHLCTPHQVVVALDATTGQEVWRYDPEIQGELALQHLTCRGLSYQPPAAGERSAAAPGSATSAGGQEGATATELSQSGQLTAPQTNDQPTETGPVSACGVQAAASVFLES